MRAAVIFGLGSHERNLKPFRANSNVSWVIGLPASSAEADAILVFGGDGTVHRHLAQLVGLQLPVLVVPCGSGNDFARALNLNGTKDSVTAWRKYASGDGRVRTIDLGVIMPLVGQESAPHQRYFCCVGGVGLDGEVSRRANRLPRWLRGHGGYVVSLPPALFRFAPLPMKISVADAERSGSFVTHSEKPVVLAAFANTPVFGGGMKIAPRAQIDDGQLDLCVISDINKLKLFCLFPTVYFGKHLSMEEVQYARTTRLRIETETPLDVYADGEYVCQTPVDVSVAPQALRVIVL
ncbi:MAG: diacylglycerol kinase family protein [Terriglobales bacterium]